MSQSNPFAQWGGLAAQQPAQSPGFTPPAAPAQPQPAGFGAQSAQAPGFGAATPAPAPGFGAHTTPAAGFGGAYNPFASFQPQVGGQYDDFPDEDGFHLVQVTRLRLHLSRKQQLRQVVETRVVASTSASLLPGRQPSMTFPMVGDYADRDKTDLLAALAGFDKTRDKDRILAEITPSVHLLANLTAGATVDWSNPASITLDHCQGPGCFVDRYVLVQTKRDKNKDGTKTYTNYRWHAVPQPPQGQAYAPEMIRAILARQYELPPVPAPNA